MSSIVVAGDTSGSVTLQAPAVAGSPVLTLPSSVGTAAQLLTTDGTGVMSWGSNVALFGTGADGAVTISSGTTLLVRDMHYSSLTINGTGSINVAGCRIFVSGTLDISNAPANAIQANASAASNASGATGGSGTYAVGSTVATLPTWGGYGFAGGTGNTTTGVNPGVILTANVGIGGTSYAGGNGGAGVSAGGNGATSISSWIWGGPKFTTPTIYFNAFSVGGNNPGMFIAYPGVAGGGGGQGGGDGTNAGGGGGGSGGGGGALAIYAAIIARGSNSTASIISAKGGAGGNGANGVAGTAGGGGGGSGGGGGWIYVIANALSGSTITNALDVSGGAGGNGGNGASTGKGGNGGGGGNSGSVQVIVLSPASYTASSVNGVIGTAGGTTSTSTGASGGAAATLRVNL